MRRTVQYSPIKVKNVKFERGTEEKAKLVLILAGGEERTVSLDTYQESRWKYFNNIVPENHCFFEVAQLGGEMLRCDLPQGGSYNFWI